MYCRLTSWAALAAAGLLAACGPSAQPNLVLITLDTTRPDHLGPYGYAKARTPNLDRFAETAAVYERAYATSSWTLPSHASLFTGLYPMEHGAQAGGPEVGRPLDDSFDTLAERLARAGYRTAGVAGGPVLSRDLGVDQGFEFYEDDFSRPEWAFAGKRGAFVADVAIRQIERFGEEPYFLFVNFFDPHAPYRPPPPYDRGLPETQHRPLALALIPHLIAGEPPRPVEDLAGVGRLRLDLIAGYDAEIAYMDLHLGRLLDAIDASPRGEETWIAITADHGESFGEHYFLSHGAHLYEDNIRVPLLVRVPGGRGAGTRIASPVENRMLFDLFLAAAGLIPPKPLDENATIVSEVERSALNVQLFGDFFDRGLRSIQLPPFKLIEDTTGRVEVFDLRNDPGEIENLAARAPELRERLSRRLLEFASAHPPRYEARPDAGPQLSPETEEALRALGYIE